MSQEVVEKRAQRVREDEQQVDDSQELRAAKQAGRAAMEDVNDVSDVDGTAIDDLLKEIDSVLEVNAEEFVTRFIQRGGQ